MQMGKCGMPCGLCPMYHIATAGRCTGCSEDRSCSIIRCCGKKNIKICSECKESPCTKITKMNEFPSFNTDKVWEKNLLHIQRIGYESWIKEYEKKVELIIYALEKYNAGRSKQFICKLFMLNEVSVLEKIMAQAEKITTDDKKEAAKQFRKIVESMVEIID